MAKPLPTPFRGNNNSIPYKLGVKEGKSIRQAEVLTFLQEKYMDDGIARDSIEGKAILTLASELAEHMRSLDG